MNTVTPEQSFPSDPAIAHLQARHRGLKCFGAVATTIVVFAAVLLGWRSAAQRTTTVAAPSASIPALSLVKGAISTEIDQHKASKYVKKDKLDNRLALRALSKGKAVPSDDVLELPKCFASAQDHFVMVTLPLAAPPPVGLDRGSLVNLRVPFADIESAAVFVELVEPPSSTASNSNSAVAYATFVITKQTSEPLTDDSNWTVFISSC